MDDTQHKRKRGRPTLPPGMKLKNVVIRLNDNDTHALDEYCSRKGWTRTQAIRKFIDLVKID